MISAQQIDVDTRNAISAPESSSQGKPISSDAPRAANPESPLEKARAVAEAMRQHAQRQESPQ